MHVDPMRGGDVDAHETERVELPTRILPEGVAGRLVRHPVDAGGFDLAGVDDHSAKGWKGHGEDVPGAVAGRDPSRALVLLAHQPLTTFEAAKHKVDLVLSGHTHGGQMVPWNHAVKLQQPFVAGLYRHEGTQVYVSRGTGYWGPPMRVGAPAEITEIELVPAEA